jgi:hypothetical protein
MWENRRSVGKMWERWDYHWQYLLQPSCGSDLDKLLSIYSIFIWGQFKLSTMVFWARLYFLKRGIFKVDRILSNFYFLQ